MHNSLSLRALLDAARDQVRRWGRIGVVVSTRLEAHGCDVPALEARLIALKEAA